MVKEGRTLEQTSHWSTSEIFAREVLLESDKVESEFTSSLLKHSSQVC